MAADRLRGTQHQVAAGIQSVVQHGDDPLLQHWAQVDQQVATAHQIEVREGRVAGEVVSGEDALLADRLAHLVAAFDLREVAPQIVGRHRLSDGLAVDAGPGAIDGALIDVGRKDLDGRPAGTAGQEIVECHGQAVGLLAARTAGHPETQLLIGRATLQQRGKDLAAQRREGLGFAEELGHHDEDVLEQRLKLGGVLVAEARRSPPGRRCGAAPCAARCGDRWC